MNVNKDAGDVCDVGLIVRDLASSIISDDKETIDGEAQARGSWLVFSVLEVHTL